MASELHVDAIKHSGGTSALTINSSGSVNIPGSIIQVVGLSNTNRGAQVTSTSTSFSHVSKLDVTITPKFSSSKIYYTASFSVAVGGANNYGYWELRRLDGSTETSFGDDANYGNSKISNEGSWMQIPLNYLDTPNSTNALTYRVYHRVHTTGTVYTGWTSGDDSKANGLYVTVMEVAQ